MCFGWWKKKVNPAFEIPMSSYSKIGALARLPNIRSINLAVLDNALDGSKAQVLYECIANSTLKGFTFINHATPNDYTGR